VVLLHGLGGESLLEWYKVIPLLGDRHRVVAFDLRNHGRSARPRRPFEIADLADDLAACLDGLGIGQAVVAGYSMGGVVAQDLAVRHPHRVGGLALIATAAHLPPIRRRSIFVLVALLGRAWERLTGLEVSRLRHHYLRRIGAVEPRHARWFWDTALNRDSNLYYESEFALLRFDGREQAGRITVPTLLVITERDWFFPVAQQRDLAARIPGAETIVLPGARHEVPWTHPAEVAAAIERVAGS
jgi:3-oxoadipate enol-lactonase